MNLKKHIIKVPEMKGRIILTYKNEMLFSAIFELKELPSFEAWNKFRQWLPLKLESLPRLIEIGCTIADDAKTNQKIATWCKVYEEHRKRKYKITPAEAGKIQHVSFDGLLLEYFFTADEFEWKDKYDIHTFVKYYNVVCDKYNHRSQPKNTGKFPNEWNISYEQKLQPAQLMEYRKHLRTLGYRPIKDDRGFIIEWRKEEVNPNSTITP